VFLLLGGRVAGISGIVGGLLVRRTSTTATNIAFVLGLLAAPMACWGFTGLRPTIHIETPWYLLVPAGLLVGFGTRLGSGCTSGHGVCGLARTSPRSGVAVGVFLTTGTVTVFLTRHVLGGGS
jgi:hypothetical protein